MLTTTTTTKRLHQSSGDNEVTQGRRPELKVAGRKRQGAWVPRPSESTIPMPNHQLPNFLHVIEHNSLSYLSSLCRVSFVRLKTQLLTYQNLVHQHVQERMQ